MGVAVPVWKREQGRFRWSSEGARGSTGEHRGSTWPKWASAQEQCGDAVCLKLEDTIYFPSGIIKLSAPQNANVLYRSLKGSIAQKGEVDTPVVGSKLLVDIIYL